MTRFSRTGMVWLCFRRSGQGGETDSDVFDQNIILHKYIVRFLEEVGNVKYALRVA